MIGSSQPESQPIKCVYFEQEGAFLFSATDNSLKLFSWEPTTCQLDSVVVNWGNVGAIGQISRRIVSEMFSVRPVSALLSIFSHCSLPSEAKFIKLAFVG